MCQLGLGRFEGAGVGTLYLYGADVVGDCDDSISDQNGGPYAALFVNPGLFVAPIEEEEKSGIESEGACRVHIDEFEQELGSYRGAILQCDSQGFFTSEFFASVDEARQRWEQVVEEFPTAEVLEDEPCDDPKHETPCTKACGACDECGEEGE